MDRCSPEAATRLLFSLKHLLVSDRFRFVVAVDRVALARFLSLFYGRVLDEEDSQWFLEKIFDDWVELPTPDFNSMLARLSESPEVGGLCGGQFRNQFMGSALGRVPRNPRKFVRACERFLRLRVQGAANRASSNEGWLLKLALCVVYAEHPHVLDGLVAGLDRAYEGDKDSDRRISLCRAYRKELLGPAMYQAGTSDPRHKSTQPRPSLERWSAKLPAVLARHIEDLSSGFNAVLEWLESDSVSKSMKTGEIERCILDVRDCR